jgi:hypothetical protein
LTDAYDPPKAANASRAATAKVTILVVLCAALGALGLLMTFTSAAALASSSFGVAASPEQARVIEEIRAAQGWWVVPLNVATLVLKFVLSLGLAVGGGLMLAGQETGRRILGPILAFGIVYELGTGLYGLVSTVVNREAMAGQFGSAMGADPTLAPEAAEMAGAAFGGMMLVMMVFMFGWAVAKAGLYAWTRRELSA